MGSTRWVSSLISSGSVRFAVLPITAISTLITARVTVQSTGIEAYGFVTTVGMLFQLLPFADLGVGANVSTTVARRGHDETSRVAACAAVLGAMRVLVVSSLVFIAIAIAGTVSGVLPRVLGIPERYQLEASLPIFLTLALYFASVPLSLGYRMLVGTGQTTKLAALGVIAPLVTCLLSILMMNWDVVPFAFAVAPILGMLVMNFVLFLLGTKSSGISVKWLLSALLDSRVRSGEVASTAWPMLIVSVSFALTLHSHRVLLANFSTAEELAVYALAIQLFLPVWSVINMASSSLWSEFSQEVGKPRLWLSANGILLGAGLAGGLALVAVGPFLLEVMSSGAELNHATILATLAVLLIVSSLNATQTALLVAGSRLRLRALLSVISLAMFTLLAVPATVEWGAAGVVLTTAICFFACQTVPGLIAGYRMTRNR